MIRITTRVVLNLMVCATLHSAQAQAPEPIPLFAGKRHVCTDKLVIYPPAVGQALADCGLDPYTVYDCLHPGELRVADRGVGERDCTPRRGNA